MLLKEFAISPYKLKATTKAVKDQYPDRTVVACMELHTFSSLKKEFLPHYKDAMKAADEAVVYFNHDVVQHKKLEPITEQQVFEGFNGGVKVMTTTADVLEFIKGKDWNNKVLLLMSSGNFDGIDYDLLAEEITKS